MLACYTSDESSLLSHVFYSSMLTEFVFPEALVVALIIRPVRVHVTHEIALASGLQNLGDIGVRPGVVTVCLVRPITIVRLSKELGIHSEACQID